MTDTATRSPQGSVGPLVIGEQGSFLCGGAVYRDEGREFRGGHAYVQYQLPVDPRPLPIVLVHGGNATGMSWETTPDGRVGFKDLLFRQGFSVYVVDLPGRGRAGAPISASKIPPPRWDRGPDLWNILRLGVWVPPAKPRFFETLAFPRDEAALDQLSRRAVVPTIPWEETQSAATVALCALADRVGPHVLVVTSASGILGWLAASRHDHVRAVVAYEPARFAFPEDEVPPSIPTSDAHVNWLINDNVVKLPADEYGRLTRIPIQAVYGDNIATEPSPVTGVETWRVSTRRAEQFVDVLRRRGADAEVVYLPEKGLRGNTHGPYFDSNNADVAGLLVDFLKSRGLA